MKNVQIPYELFMLLIRHYLVEDDTCLDEIRQGLEKKLDSLVQHELYGKPDRNIWIDVECWTVSAGSVS